MTFFLMIAQISLFERLFPGSGTISFPTPEKKERPDRSLSGSYSRNAEVTSSRERPCSRARRARSSYSAFRRVTPQPEETFTPTGPQGVSACSTVRSSVCRRHRDSRMPRKKGNGLPFPFQFLFSQRGGYLFQGEALLPGEAGQVVVLRLPADHPPAGGDLHSHRAPGCLRLFHSAPQGVPAAQGFSDAQEKRERPAVSFPVLILATRKLPLPGTGPAPGRGGPGRRAPPSGGSPPSRRRPSLPPGPRVSPSVP